jgi:hypothetical protein
MPAASPQTQPDPVAHALAEIRADIAALMAVVRAIQRDVQRLQQPLQRLTRDEVAGLLGFSVSALAKLDARGVFTDARGDGCRVAGSKRLYFADEITIYETEGTAGVRRFRREVGRL